MTQYQTKRVYEDAEQSDGYRVLVDRLWPRGVSKEKAKLDEWSKDIAPTDELRKWFGHDPAKYLEFKQRYEKELDDTNTLDAMRAEWSRHDVVTLLYGAHDKIHNQAVVLKSYLMK